MKPRFFITVAMLASIVAAPFIGCHIFYRNHYLTFVPSEFGVWRVLYASTESWGLGPGGNETGILVYALPDDTRRQIEKEGLTYLEGLAENRAGGWRGRYKNWMETPVDWQSWRFSESQILVTEENVSIVHYLNRYGFSVHVAEEFKEEIDGALFSRGNYYAYGRNGMIVVSPGKGRVYYAYRG